MQIELNAVKEIPIPNGWGCDASGVVSINKGHAGSRGGHFRVRFETTL